MDRFRVEFKCNEKPDERKFKSLTMVRQVLKEGQAASIVFNAANEIANKAFLKGEIKFTKIYDAIEHALCHIKNNKINSIDDVIAQDTEARHFTNDYLKNTEKKVSYA